MDIRLATNNDLKGINKLFKSVIEDMNIVKRVNIWDNIYPFCEFEKDISSGKCMF